ncbi:MAG: acyl carrier protein [Chloroflexi bacterium]|nr:acyl carrier protein [Chloroflexota bacterium]
MDRSEVAEKLKTYIKTELLNNPDYALGDDEPLISGGLLNSFALAQIGVFVEEEFDVYIPDDELSV